ncbi:MAG: formate-nitrite transporter family protein [Mycobacterium sp.]|nr:formate-nitrite transporter family protein [Mycobacterium sp.]MDT5260055.1 formate-nitrite transporter family protein [Mycobacterium sp.]
MSSGKADGDAAAVEPNVAPHDEEATFDRLVDEGTQRLGRSWVQLIATGLLGGLDIGVGLLAFLLVKHLTNNELLASLAFSSGFIALTLARSEVRLMQMPHKVIGERDGNGPKT